MEKKCVPLIRSALSAIIENPVILFPFITIAFLQLLVLEILNFGVRPPLSAVFAPVIEWRLGSDFLHYPLNYIATLKMFQTAQYFLFTFFGAACICMAALIIADINNGRAIALGRVFRRVLKQYVHIVIFAVLFLLFFFVFKKMYDLVYYRALAIRSINGPYFILKQVVVNGRPYFSLSLGILVTVLFAFVPQFLILEKRKIQSALWQNWKLLLKSPFFVLFVVLLPTLLYLPFIVLQKNIAQFSNVVLPSFRIWAMSLSIIVMMLIDSLVYTALTTFYLIKKEA